MESNKQQAAEQAMEALREAAENLDRVRLAIEKAYGLMLENGLGRPEDRADISKADLEVVNLGCMIHRPIIRGLENN